MVDPFAPRSSRNKNPYAPREDKEPDYRSWPGFDSDKGDFFGAASVPSGRNFWGTQLGGELENDLDQQSALQAETEAERMRTNSYVNAYRLAAERRGNSAYMTQSGKSPVSNTMAEVGKAVGGAAISALTGKAVMAGFALI